MSADGDPAASTVDAAPARVAHAGRATPAGERGGTSVVGAALVAVAVLLTLTVTAASALLVERQHVAGAADAAALAAADAVSGLTAGDPCRVASDVAEAQATRVVECRVDGPDATVEVVGVRAGARVVARATAGPPPDRAGGG